MPGGLTRVSSQQDKLVVSNQAGGISKDTWVLATEPEKYVSLLSERRQARLAPEPARRSAGSCRRQPVLGRALCGAGRIQQPIVETDPAVHRNRRER